MNRQDIVNKVMAMNAGTQDTFTMLKSVENIPSAMLPRIVSISPQGVYTSGGAQIEYGTPPSYTTDTTTDGTSAGVIPAGTSGGTTDGTAIGESPFFYTEQQDPTRWTINPNYVSAPLPSPVEFHGAPVISDPNVPPGHMYMFDPAYVHQEIPPTPRKRKQKKALPPSIKVQPRTPGVRRIVLED